MGRGKGRGLAGSTLHRLAPQGMGAGGDFEIATNGEDAVLQSLGRKFGAQPCAIVFDVGGNRGTYTKAALNRFPNAEIYVFEPTRHAHADFIGNVSDSRCTALNFGLSDTGREVVLHSTVPACGLAPIYKRQLDHYNMSMD
ncbi:class I SAM-dependent methyltransferase [Arenibaculum pallidiluteum]|uniref:hypothetical protein n=1 Tax=Arenibaculum pallidiluteum TaxID=2812559 RepID=UPI001A96B733|nr:hypothetical protein [Arenibaculum pallidiluteum]